MRGSANERGSYRGLKLTEASLIALRGLVLFVQFKKREKRPWRGVTKGNTPPWVFFHVFLNCTNSTKSCKAAHILKVTKRVKKK